MTTVEPQPTPVPVATQVQPPAPTPIPPTPAIPLPDSHRHKKKHHHRPIIIGEDPRPPEFHPTPGEPMDPGGEFDTDIFRQNSQTGTETSTKGGKNKVDWFEQDHVDPRLKKCGENCPPEKPKQPKIVESCENVKLPSAPTNKKLDVLFVVDTSASFFDELVKITSQMDEFIKNLKPDVDYQIAVLPAHGPKGPYFGRIYSDVITYRGIQGSRAATAQLVDTIKKLFSDKSAKDPSYSIGETGMLSLYASIAMKSRLNENLRKGFYRDDASLAVIFVADENDACYQYKPGETPHMDDYGNKKEKLAFEKECVYHNGRRFQPIHVAWRLNELKGNLPVIITGLVYTSNNIPKTSGKYHKEKELGHGYLDLIEGPGKGLPVDLANPDFGASLAKLGQFSQFRMQYPNQYSCVTSVPKKEIDLDSFKITLEKNGRTLGVFYTGCKSDPSKCPAGSHAAGAERVQKNPYVQIAPNMDAFHKLARPGATLKMSFRRK